MELVPPLPPESSSSKFGTEDADREEDPPSASFGTKDADKEKAPPL